MSRVRWSLRTRLVVVFGATFVLMQLADAAYLLRASRGATRQRLESAAHQYAIIVTIAPTRLPRFHIDSAIQIVLAATPAFTTRCGYDWPTSITL